jgi:hypothetical protein
LAVIVIIGLLSFIAVIFVLGMIEGTEEDVCEANRRQLEKDYHRELVLNEVDHSESRFDLYVLWFGEVCPVECSVHVGDEETGEEDGD